MKLGEPIPRTTHYSWGETDADIDAEVGQDLAAKYRKHLSGFLPVDATSDGMEFVKLFWNEHTREMRTSSEDFAHCKRMVRADVTALRVADLLRALYLIACEVKKRKFYKEARCLSLGKGMFREASAPLSFLGTMKDMVECVNNAAGYATMALMHYLTWQRKRRFKVGIDATFNSERFVRVSLFKGGV